MQRKSRNYFVGIPIGFGVGLVASEILPIKSFTKNSASMIFR